MTDTNKLLAAAKVHKIASEKRDEARRVATEVMKSNGKKFVEWEWDHHNPTSRFIPEALADLEAIAALLWPAPHPETP